MISILQMSKLRLREVELLAQGLNGKAVAKPQSRVTILGPRFPHLCTKKPRDPPVPKGLGSLS